MMNRRMRALLLILVSWTAGAQTLPGVIGRLELVPPVTLPGIPVSYRLTVANNGAAPVSLQGAELFIVDESGQLTAIDAKKLHYSASYGFYDREDRPKVVAPGTERKQWIPISMGLYHATEFGDDRLVRPGKVVLRFRFYADEGQFLSNPATLTIEEPQGIDREVYELMKQTAGGSWTIGDWGIAGRIAETVFRRYPQSRYLPYFLDSLPPPVMATLDEQDQAIAASEGTVIADLLRESKAIVLADEAIHLSGQGDLDGALALNGQARDILEQLARTSRYSFIRENAQTYLAKRQTNDALRNMFKFRFETNVPPLKVKPFADCVTRNLDGGRMLVRFGYENPNDKRKIIAVGRGNRVLPGPPYQGQPRSFQSGRLRDVFSVVARMNEDVRWELEGESAGVTAATPACTTPPDTMKVTPTIECVKREGNHLVVHFGYHNRNPYAVPIAAGADNRVDVAGIEAPPTVFPPGIQSDGWKVKLKDASSITWTLQGTSVTATAADAQKKCSFEKD